MDYGIIIPYIIKKNFWEKIGSIPPLHSDGIFIIKMKNELPENKFNEGDIVTLKYTSLQGKIAEVIYDSKFNIYRYFVLFKLSGGLTLRSIYLENNLE